MIDLNRLPPPPTKNAMTPALWLTGIMAIVLVPATPFLPLWAAIVGWLMLSIIILVTVWSYVHFVKHDPSQLRSEDHALKITALNIYDQSPGKATEIARIISSPTKSAQKFLRGPADD